MHSSAKRREKVIRLNQKLVSMSLFTHPEKLLESHDVPYALTASTKKKLKFNSLNFE